MSAAPGAARRVADLNGRTIAVGNTIAVARVKTTTGMPVLRMGKVLAIRPPTNPASRALVECEVDGALRPQVLAPDQVVVVS